MEENYKLKYFKYKAKYLKKLYGGNIAIDYNIINNIDPSVSEKKNFKL